MEFKKLNAPTLKELFSKELEAMILSGRLEIGEKLPSERELAQSMQVSRAVVNSGIAELARKGFLHVKPRSGIYVADYRRYGTIETLLSIMNYNGGQLRHAEIRSILELKIVLDRLTIELAIDKLNSQNLNVLKEKLEEMNHEKPLEETAESIFDFYHELTVVSDNSLLPLIYRSFYVPIIHLWMRFVRKYGIQEIYESAQKIYTALECRDKDAAISASEAAVNATLSGDRKIYED